MKKIEAVVLIAIAFNLLACSKIESPALAKHAKNAVAQVVGEPNEQLDVRFVGTTGIKRALGKYTAEPETLPGLSSVIDSGTAVGVLMSKALPGKGNIMLDALFIPIDCRMVDPPENCTTNGYLFQLPGENGLAADPKNDCFDCSCLGGDGNCYCWETSPPCLTLVCGDCSSTSSCD